MQTTTHPDGRTIVIGTRVEIGTPGAEDYDHGTVTAIRSLGEIVMVAWSVAQETYNEETALLRVIA